ncbi:hypothetical protein ACLF6K_13305 [Streptomyces xanthophaeus]|uniref:hypothetical protein n=1 Tax=Streptomyces xanthophaeus TaxID=67385 RepID=UPI00398FF656
MSVRDPPDTWATSGYAATYAVVSLFSGALARRFGTRAMLVAGVGSLPAAALSRCGRVYAVAARR